MILFGWIELRPVKMYAAADPSNIMNNEEKSASKSRQHWTWFFQHQKQTEAVSKNTAANTHTHYAEGMFC